MTGIHSFRCESNRIHGTDPASPNGFFRNIPQRNSSDNGHFTSVPSPFSRNRSRTSETPSPTASPLSRDRSRKSTSSSASFAAPLSRKPSQRNNTPIMFSNSSGMLKPPAIEKQLECTLEELCFGCTKNIKITRDVHKKTGQFVKEEELLTIKVKPGWKKGTKITFEGMGNERPGMLPADITFIIAEKRHYLFTRDGDDLELVIEIPLVKALTGCKLSVPLLGGDRLRIRIDDIIYPGYETVVEEQGMPISEEQGKRGTLRVVFLVEFPKNLDDERRFEAAMILEGSS